jgi:hypothetical protein
MDVRDRGYYMKYSPFLTVFVLLLWTQVALGANSRISEGTEACIACHATVHPGIVADWEKSRMARVTPRAARSMISRKRRVSFDKVPEGLGHIVVGCAECHTMNPEKHEDTFEHYGQRVHVIVTPEDCAICHPVEAAQYSKNIMSRAYGNLKDNLIYDGLITSANGMQSFSGIKVSQRQPDEKTNEDSCFHCHGTAIEVKGT